MTSLQLFYNRECPGNSLRSNVLQALDHLETGIPLEEVETEAEQAGCALPALALDGKIIVSGVEPSVRELELLLSGHLENSPGNCPCSSCFQECGALQGTSSCPMRAGRECSGSVAGKIIGFAILLIILFLAVKILS